jgi:hypothetical protein
LVDSSVWIDHFRNVESAQVRRLRRLVSEEPLLIGDLILCEILQGFNSEAEARLVQPVRGCCAERPEPGGDRGCELPASTPPGNYDP